MTSSILSVLCLVLSVLCCGSGGSSLEDLTSRNTDFAARLYRAVSSQTDDNVFLSTFTLSGGLLALLSGTGGSTQDQLLQGLGLTGLDPNTLPDLFQSLQADVLQGSLVMNLRHGVAVLPAMGFPVSSSYMELVQNKFRGNAQSLAYTNPSGATDTINSWAQEQTGDNVRDLVTNLDPQSQLLLASTAFYQTRFSPSFNASFTQDERFYVDRYHVVMVPMMFRAEKYFLAYDRSLKVGVLKLPMAGRAAMLVVLPDEGVDITAVEDDVTGEKIQTWIRQLKKTKLEVQLPRFLLERSYTLRDVLQTLNITQVFQEDADTSSIGGAKGPSLTQVYHKSIFSADESSDGVTTGGGASVLSSLPPRLTVNRPFIFIVYHETGCVLAMGRVIDPSRK